MLRQLRPGVSGLHYAWVIVAVTFVAVIVTAGVRATPGVLIVPLEQEFHWSRATISFALGINLLLYGVIGPFAAAIMDRFGVRRTMILSFAASAAGVALTPGDDRALAADPAVGLVVGLGTGFIGAYLAAFIAARWFRTAGARHRPPDRGQCRRPARLSADHGGAGHAWPAGGSCRWPWPGSSWLRAAVWLC